MNRHRILIFSVIFLSMMATEVFSAPKVTEGNSCKKILGQMIKQLKKLPKLPRVDAFKSYEIFEEKHLPDFFKYIEEELEFDKSELEMIHKSALEALNKLPKEQIYSLVVYSKSLNKKQRPKILSSFLILKDLDNQDRSLKKFFKIQKVIDKKTSEEYQKQLIQLKKKNSGAPDKFLQRKIVDNIKGFRRVYEKMSYGCRSNIWTAERTAAKDAFLKFKIGIGMASSVAGYAYQNQDKFKEDKKLWASKLGYELTFGVISNYISVGILANPRSSLLAKSGYKYFNARVQGLLDWSLYGNIFGTDEEQSKKEVKRILADPEKRKHLHELVRRLDNEEIYTKFKSALKENLKSFLESFNFANYMFPKIEGIDWEKLTEADLERKDVMHALTKAVMAHAYDESKGGLIQLGTIGADRFAFHAGYGVLLLPRDMLVDLYIYHILCMGALNPKAAFLKALGIYTVNRVVFDQLYYWARKTAVNQ